MPDLAFSKADRPPPGRRACAARRSGRMRRPTPASADVHHNAFLIGTSMGAALVVAAVATGCSNEGRCWACQPTPMTTQADQHEGRSAPSLRQRSVGRRRVPVAAHPRRRP